MGQPRIKRTRWKGARLTRTMKKLLFTPDDARAMEVCYNGFMAGSRPENGTLRTALKIEDKLLEVTVESQGVPLTCPNCGKQDFLTEKQVPDALLQLTKRTLRDVTITELLLEDAEYAYLKGTLQKVQPPQPMVRHFVRLMDILDSAETVKV